MQSTVVVETQCFLPASSVLAILLAILPGRASGWWSNARILGGGGHPELVVALILPEVQALSWVDLCPYSYLKVLVRDLSISVCIEFVEYLLELSIGDPSEAPVLEVEPELFGFDGP